MSKGYLLLAEGFEEIEAVTPVDLLRRASIEVITLGLGHIEITGNHGITVKADQKITKIDPDEHIDFIIVPGGMPGAENILKNDEACGLISAVFNSGGVIGAICAAPAVVLSPLGILTGKKATCFPGYEKTFTDAEFSNERVVKDGNIITSRAAGTAAEFSHVLIETLAGKNSADTIRERTLQP